MPCGRAPFILQNGSWEPKRRGQPPGSSASVGCSPLPPVAASERWFDDQHEFQLRCTLLFGETHFVSIHFRTMVLRHANGVNRRF